MLKTLGEFLDMLNYAKRAGATNEPLHVSVYAWSYGAVADWFGSYRGHYDHAAIEIAEWDRARGRLTSVGALADRIEQAIDRREEFEGWKGGTYVFGRDTPLWFTRGPGVCDGLVASHVSLSLTPTHVVTEVRVRLLWKEEEEEANR